MTEQERRLSPWARKMQAAHTQAIADRRQAEEINGLQQALKFIKPAAADNPAAAAEAERITARLAELTN